MDKLDARSHFPTIEVPEQMESAIEAFLSRTDDFEVDHEREKFLITFNPSGYLRRVR